MSGKNVPQIRFLVRALLGWFIGNARELPWRLSRDPYAVWVSEIMLQQTQVKTVIPYWERWMRALPTVKALAAATPESLYKLWEGLGYYTRVRNMQKAAWEIVAKHDGIFPRDHEAIRELPGIGRYTAGAISSIAFNEPRPILDGNVIRVLTRLFGLEENPREKTANEKLWLLAGQLVTAAANSALPPSTYDRSAQAQRSNPPFLACSHLNQSLMELGALICTPRQPKCPVCPVRPNCVACRTGRVGKLPNLGSSAPTSSRHFVAFVIERRGRILVRQRPAGVVNAHLWEFPNFELTKETSDLRALAKMRLGLTITRLLKLHTVKHSITRYRITLEAYRAILAPKASVPGDSRASKVWRDDEADTTRTAVDTRWLRLGELDSLAFASAHRKILEAESLARANPSAAIK